MNSLSLMSRAKAMLQHRAAGSALVILPLALAAHASADSLFTPGSTFVSGPQSGGKAFGHASTALLDGGQGVELTGDTVAVKTGVYVTAAQAGSGALPGSIIYSWSGGFASGSTLDTTDTLLLSEWIPEEVLPPAKSDDVTWTIDFTIDDACGNLLAEQSVSSSDLGNSFLQSVATAGIPDTWNVQLVLNWNFPTVESGGVIIADPSVAGDQLNANPLIDVTVVSQAGSSIPPTATPLPAAFWPGASLLTLLAAGALLRNRRPRPSL